MKISYIKLLNRHISENKFPPKGVFEVLGSFREPRNPSMWRNNKNERKLCVDNTSLCDESKSRKISENK